MGVLAKTRAKKAAVAKAHAELVAASKAHGSMQQSPQAQKASKALEAALAGTSVLASWEDMDEAVKDEPGAKVDHPLPAEEVIDPEPAEEVIDPEPPEEVIDPQPAEEIEPPLVEEVIEPQPAEVVTPDKRPWTPAREVKVKKTKRMKAIENWAAIFALFCRLHTLITTSRGDKTETFPFRNGSGTVECCKATVMLGLLKWFKPPWATHPDKEGHYGFLCKIVSHFIFYMRNDEGKKKFQDTICRGEYEAVGSLYIQWCMEGLPSDETNRKEIEAFVDNYLGREHLIVQQEIYDLYIASLPIEEEDPVFNPTPADFPRLSRTPAVPTPKSPAVPTPKSPAVPAPKSPAVPTPKSPAVPTPKSPAVPTPKSPGVPAPKSPAVPTPESPGVPAPKSPAVPTPKTPAVPTLSKNFVVSPWGFGVVPPCAQVVPPPCAQVVAPASVPYIPYSARVLQAVIDFKKGEKLDEFGYWVSSAAKYKSLGSWERLKKEVKTRWYTNLPVDGNLETLFWDILGDSEDLAALLKSD